MSYATLPQLKRYLDINDNDTFAPANVSAGDDDIDLSDQAFVDRLDTADEVRLESSESPADLPAPLAEDTTYYVILDTDLTIQLATTSALADAGTAINITDAGTGMHTIKLWPSNDTLLQACLDRATLAIDRYTERYTFSATTDETRYYDYDDVEARTVWLDEDLYSLTSITNGDSDSSAIATTDVTLLPRNQGPPYHRVLLDESSTSVWDVDTDYWIQIEGKWGWSATAPDDVVQACVRWAAYIYRQRDAGVFETTAIPEAGVIQIPEGMPRDVKVLLDSYRKLRPW